MEKITWYGSGGKPQAANGSGGAGENALSFRIGSVRSGDTPSVSNSGTGGNVVLDFVLPKGEKGEKGEKGDGNLAGIGGFLEGLSVELAILKEMLPFSSMQMGKELCVASNPNVKLVETYGTGNAACYKIRYPTPFSQVPVLLVTSSRSTQQMRMIEILVKAIINTTGLIDSHQDLHIPGIWNKSVKENKSILHVQEHKSWKSHKVWSGPKRSGRTIRNRLKI